MDFIKLLKETGRIPNKFESFEGNNGELFTHQKTNGEAEGSEGAKEAAVASEGQGEADMCAGEHLYETNELGSYCSKCGKQMKI
jgi:hypothetical protein